MWEKFSHFRPTKQKIWNCKEFSTCELQKIGKNGENDGGKNFVGQLKEHFPTKWDM